MPIQFRCPACNRRLSIAARKAGTSTACPACGAAVPVPDSAAPPAPPSDDGFDLPYLPPAPPPIPVTVSEPEPPKRWRPDRLVLAGASAALALVILLAVVIRKPAPTPDIAKADPSSVAPPERTPKAVPIPPVAPKPVPQATRRPTPVPPPVPLEPAPPPREVSPSAPAGVSESRLDQFGNPVGQNHGLGRYGEFKGQRLLFWFPHDGSADILFGPENPLWKGFEDKGFAVRRAFGKFDPEWLKDTDQLWILSTAPEKVLAEQRDQINRCCGGSAEPDFVKECNKELKASGATKRDGWTLAEAERLCEKVLAPSGRKLPAGYDPRDYYVGHLIDWFHILSPSRHLTAADYDAIEAFARRGKGLCLLADNDPLTTEANELARRLFGVGVSGNYEAHKIARVRNGQSTPALAEKFKDVWGGLYDVPDHPLLAGVNFVYEGITTSHVPKSDKLDVALPASDGNAVVSVSKVPGLRVVLDCGHTRYWDGTYDETSCVRRTAGTIRLAQNIAAYLAGKDVPKMP